MRRRNPVAKQVRTPAFKQRVVPDIKKYKRKQKHKENYNEKN